MNEPKKVKVFAYGSNMCSQRMRKRIPSAKSLGRAKLPNKRLVCNKRSDDGSAKANLENTGELVWGVLYEMDSAELNTLDNCEKGYERINIDVQTDAGLSENAFVYVATETANLTHDHRPYEWYKKYIISGALEHKLPTSYINFLEKIESKPDLRNSVKRL